MTARAPVGWSTAKLGDVTLKPLKCDPVSTGRRRVRYVDIGQLEGPTSDLSDAPAVDSQMAPSRCRQVLEGGDTLYSTVRPYLRKIAFVQQALDGEFASTGYCVLRPAREIHPRFLYYFTLSKQFEDQVLPLQKGVSYPAVLDREVRAQRIWYPGLREQRRIVELLEDHLGTLARAEEHLFAVLQRLEVLERSVHQLALRGELVPDDLSEGTGRDLLAGAASLDPATLEERSWPTPSAWTWSRIGDLFTVSVGTTPSRGVGTLWNGGVPWVSSGEVAFNRIKTTRETIAPAAVSGSKRLHPPGTVMLAMIGEGKTRGQTAILDIEAAHNQNCASIRVSETRILPEYVFAFFKERYLETRRGSSGGNQPALNKGRIQGIPIPVPPLGTQRLIVEELDRFATSCSYLRNSCRTSLGRVHSLRKALLTAAFEGKLAGRHTDHEAIEERAEALGAKENSQP